MTNNQTYKGQGGLFKTHFPTFNSLLLQIASYLKKQREVEWIR